MTATLLKYKLLIIILACFSSASLASEKHLFNLNIDNLTQQVKPEVDSLFSHKSVNASIQLPLPSGQFVSFTAQETQVLPPKLAKKYADIKTYRIHSENQGLSGRMSLSEQGAYISIHSRTGREASISPVTERSTSYISQWKDETPTSHQQHRDDQIFAQPLQEQLPKLSHREASDTTSARLIQYRIAVAANSDFVADQGGNVATTLAAIVHTINRVNHVFERDLGIHLVLVENNDLLIFDNASNDPYYGSLHEMAFQNQEITDRIIGTENYDLGHLFAAQGGGAAYVQSACRDGAKAIAVSANLSVGSKRFATEFVAHEIGHQFGATHTFSSNKGLCTTAAFTGSSAYEPGSGASIMSYVGLCGTDNLQAHADDMFHIGSIEQVNRYKKKIFNNGCGKDIITTPSQITTIDAGKDYTIPSHTAFELSAPVNASDFSQYNWQQLDSSSNTTELGKDTGYNALFRSFYPQSHATRHFPQLKLALQGKTSRGELLPQLQRKINFRFIAHLKKGGLLTDNVELSVINTGQPFKINAIRSNYKAGNPLSLSWDVAGTNTPPINCSAIDISITESITEPSFKMIAKNVPNNGQARILLTKTYSTKSIVKIKCSDNIFYALSTKAQQNTATQPTLARSNSINNSGGGGALSPYLFLLLLLVAYLPKR